MPKFFPVFKIKNLGGGGVTNVLDKKNGKGKKGKNVFLKKGNTCFSVDGKTLSLISEQRVQI